MTLRERDERILWHPFTQKKTAPAVIPVHKASGCYLYDEQGKAYLDLISSWWVNLHGHGNEVIAQAIYTQAKTLEHVIFAGFTHEPAVRLCEELKKLLPASFARFFFSDNGSTAVEVALKMAYQYWWNQGCAERKIFLSFEGGYHGDTFGSMSVGAQSGFHGAFSSLFFQTISLPFPHTWQEDEACEDKEAQSLQVLDQVLDAHAHHVAALVVEPLVQGASGMRMCRPEFIEEVVQRVRQQGILIIFDEVMTGFGRTGTMFALDQLDVTPDFVCLSKGLTGGFLPLALTVTTQQVYEAFLCETFDRAFAHGHSYTANPLGCAAALASLKLLQDPGISQSLVTIHQMHQQGLASFKQCSSQALRRRCLGTIAAFDMPSPQEARSLCAQLMQEGLLLRPLGSCVYLVPPYCINSEQLQEAYGKMLQLFTRN